LFGAQRNPFAGNWVEDVASCRFEFGLPPRAATLTITEESNGLKVTDDAVLTDGQARHLSYALKPDGAERPDPTGTADTVTATIKGTSLQAVFRKAGMVVEQKTGALSPDHKEMTLTITTHPPGKPNATDVLQFERK
jgi:hypothetical protein